jgi:hypothetical protein
VRRHLLLLTLAALALVLLAACDNPVGYQTDHIEAVEVVLRDPATGFELARTDENRAWTGPMADGIRVGAGQALGLRVRFVTIEGREVGLDVFAGLSLRAEWDPDGLAIHEPLDTLDVLHGLRPGQTALRLMVWHGDHADLVAPPLPVIVVP